MPLSREHETQYGENAKFLYATKTTNPGDPIQLAFAVTDEQGNEQILLGEVPSTFHFYNLCVESGWLREPRTVSISQKQRRMAAS